MRLRCNYIVLRELRHALHYIYVEPALRLHGYICSHFVPISKTRRLNPYPLLAGGAGLMLL